MNAGVSLSLPFVLADVLRVRDPRSEKAPGSPLPSIQSSPTFNHTRLRVALP
jgi:hypothetical protein